MYKFFKLCSLVICALFTFGAVADQAAQDERKVVIEQYKWFGDSPKAKLVRVINPYGNVTSRSSMEASVELSGSIQKIGDNPPKHTIDINDNDGVTEIVISYPTDSIRNAKGQLTGRFDLGVWLPSYVKLDVETDFGDIKVKRSASDIVARSNSGKISIGTSGHVEAMSLRGDISVDFYGERFRHGMKVVSRFGDVKVNMSQDTRLVLKASAAKGIKENFADYKTIEVSGDKKLLNAKITKATKHKFQPVDLYLAATKGSVAINIADKVSRKVLKTPPSFAVNGKSNKNNTNKSNNKGGQSSVNTASELATAR